MIPKILNKMGVEIGLLPDLVEGYAIEERNGMCELEMVYPIFSTNWTHLDRGNIIVVDQNDVLKEQKYRIYKVTKPFGGLIQVYARHISFDLARDIIEDINLENASCEYGFMSISWTLKFELY
ncbi:phage tail spike protein [uncultured Clostridium sp.]|uniref:phage tail spike protein n=1 Tax=uncultured Clostridium sp. TaxID=59620 RepID=UPI00261F2128|nr:phage tail spike protein [uncultured Clostridium sp.]